MTLLYTFFPSPLSPLSSLLLLSSILPPPSLLYPSFHFSPSLLPFPLLPLTVMVENLSVFLYSRDQVVDLVLPLHTSLIHSLASYSTMPPTPWRNTTKNLRQCSNSQPSISNDFRFNILSSSVLYQTSRVAWLLIGTITNKLIYAHYFRSFFSCSLTWLCPSWTKQQITPHVCALCIVQYLAW